MTNFVINTISGQVGTASDIVLNDPNLNKYIKVVPEGTKPLVEGMFVQGTVDEFNAGNNNYPDNEPVAEPEQEVTPVVSEDVNGVVTPTETVTI